MSSGIDGIGYTSATSSQALYSTTTATSPTDQLRNATNPFADPNGPFANLNLTAQQQTQIQQLFDQGSASSTQTPTQLFNQIESLLTPQQQATLRSDLETLGAKLHHHHHRSDASANASPSAATTSSSDPSVPSVAASDPSQQLNTSA